MNSILHYSCMVSRTSKLHATVASNCFTPFTNITTSFCTAKLAADLQQGGLHWPQKQESGAVRTCGPGRNRRLYYLLLLWGVHPSILFDPSTPSLTEVVTGFYTYPNRVYVIFS